MNLADLTILGFILLGGIIGLKRGVVKQGVKSLGLVIIIIAAFFLKNPISKVLYGHLPFFKFGGVIKGVTSLNILLYEIIAFIIVLSVLLIIFKIILIASNLVEKILDATVILGLLSSVLGFILGLIEYFIISFIILYIVSMPTFKISFFDNSKVGDGILSNTPVLSGFIKKQYSVFEDFDNIKKKYKTEKNTNKFNLETLELFLKYDIVDVDSVQKLVEKDKLEINGVEELLEKYKEE